MEGRREAHFCRLVFVTFALLGGFERIENCFGLCFQHHAAQIVALLGCLLNLCKLHGVQPAQNFKLGLLNGCVHGSFLPHDTCQYNLQKHPASGRLDNFMHNPGQALGLWLAPKPRSVGSGSQSGLLAK